MERLVREGGKEAAEATEEVHLVVGGLEIVDRGDEDVELLVGNFLEAVTAEEGPLYEIDECELGLGGLENLEGRRGGEGSVEVGGW